MSNKSTVRIIKPEEIYKENYSSTKIQKVAAYCRVSTENSEQILSYDSQIAYYYQKIQSNPAWMLTKIYADRGIGGMSAENRIEFQQMILDAIEGNIDLIITKSVSRFARNTLDTLKYVRKLKEHNVAVIFEKENINTLKDGEYFLVLLSSIAQQESENLSGNVTMGLKMKMKCGEYPFRKCYGYDYDIQTKEIVVNEKEAVVINYIYELYLSGLGTHRIAGKLNQKKIKTPTGKNLWDKSSVLNILTNEKYKGDIRLRKTFTYDVLNRKRKTNKGEKEQYYIKNNHESIVLEEIWDKTQSLMKIRKREKAEKYRNYPFTKRIRCGSCGYNYTRRSVDNHNYWACYSKWQRGKETCPNSKAIKEEKLEQAFVIAFNKLVSEKELIIAEANDLNRHCSSTLLDIDEKISRLIDLRLNDSISTEHYIEKYQRLMEEKEKFEIGNNNVAKTSNIIINKFRSRFKEKIEKFSTDLFLELVKFGELSNDADGNHKIRFFVNSPYDQLVEYVDVIIK